MLPYARMRTHTVRKVGIGSLAKILGFLYAAIGVIAGAVISLASLAGAAFGQAAGGEEGAAAAVIGLVFGVGAIIVLPIFYGVMGLVGGLIMGAVYNIAAGVVGGIKIDLDVDAVPQPSVSQGP